MRFYNDTDATIWDGKKTLKFIDGVLEVNDNQMIALLKGAGYKHDEGETQSTLDVETKDEYSEWTKNELVRELVLLGVDFDKRQPKSELVALLEGAK